MDGITHTPGAGHRAPVLVGRDDLLKASASGSRRHDGHRAPTRAGHHPHRTARSRQDVDRPRLSRRQPTAGLRGRSASGHERQRNPDRQSAPPHPGPSRRRVRTIGSRQARVRADRRRQPHDRRERRRSGDPRAAAAASWASEPEILLRALAAPAHARMSAPGQPSSTSMPGAIVRSRSRQSRCLPAAIQNDGDGHDRGFDPYCRPPQERSVQSALAARVLSRHACRCPLARACSITWLLERAHRSRVPRVDELCSSTTRPLLTALCHAAAAAGRAPA